MSAVALKRVGAVLQEVLPPKGRQTVLFIFKSVIAALLALWLSLRFGLDRPSTSMVTVFIVAQPQSGLVLAKAAYRALGTLIGCAAALVLLWTCGSVPELFLSFLAVWIGLCAAGAARFRDFKAYAFVLSGYTACLVGLPAAITTDGAFPMALSRVSEVLLGIFCASVVSELIAPQKMVPMLVALIRGRYRDFAEGASKVFRGELDEAATAALHKRLSGEIMRMESLRAAAYFEDAETRVRNVRLRQVNGDFMTMLTSFHAFERLARRLERAPVNDGIRALRLAVEPLAAFLEKPAGTAAEAAGQIAVLERIVKELEPLSLPGSVAAAYPELARDVATGSALVQQLGEELLQHLRSYGALVDAGWTADDRPSPARFVPHADMRTAITIGMRVLISTAISSIFWLETGWPQGPGFVLNSVVVCCLFAAAPRPEAPIGQMVQGAIISVILGLICAMFLLPYTTDFLTLAVVLTPFLVLGVWLMSFPQLFGVGTGFLVFFCTLVVPAPKPQVDPTAIIELGLSIVVGFMTGGLSFSVFVPAGPDSRLRRLHASLRDQLDIACHGSLKGLVHRVDGQVRDLISQVAITPAPPEKLGALQDYGLDLLEAAHAIVQARQLVDEHPELQSCVRSLRDLLDCIVECCRRPSTAARERALAAIESMIAALTSGTLVQPPTPELNELVAALHRLRAALVDITDFYLTPEPAHAA